MGDLDATSSRESVFICMITLFCCVPKDQNESMVISLTKVLSEPVNVRNTHLPRTTRIEFTEI